MQLFFDKLAIENNGTHTILPPTYLTEDTYHYNVSIETNGTEITLDYTWNVATKQQEHYHECTITAYFTPPLESTNFDLRHKGFFQKAFFDTDDNYFTVRCPDTELSARLLSDTSLKEVLNIAFEHTDTNLHIRSQFNTQEPPIIVTFSSKKKEEQLILDLIQIIQHLPLFMSKQVM